MARILVVADAGAPTGFGTVTHNIFERLVDRHDIHVLAANYRGDHVDTPLKLYVPTMDVAHDVHGNSRLLKLCAQIQPDIVFFINDPHVVLHTLLDNAWDPQYALWRGAQFGDYAFKPRLMAYMPIDGYDSPKSWDKLTERVERIAMSHFGQETMPEAPVVWHGVNPIFQPMNKRGAKIALGYDPDRFLILRVDKNSFRKDYPDTWRALRPVLRRHKDIDVHFHCTPTSIDGFDLPAFIWNDEDIRDRVTFSPNLAGYNGWPLENLATLYNAADLFVTTSHGEGFGLTILEAMACGTPVIATDCSAITEVVGPGGVLIPPARQVAAPMGQSQVLADIDRFSAEIEHLYVAAGSRRKLGEKAAAHAKQFSWDVAAEKVHALIESPREAPAS